MDGKLICPKSNGGCGRASFTVSISGSRIYLDCRKCKYRISIPIDMLNFTDVNTGPLETVKIDSVRLI